MLGGRHKAREILFRVLFEVDITGDDPRDALEGTIGRFRLTEEGRDHAVAMAAAYTARRAEIDDLLRARLQNWTLERLSGVARTLLRLAAIELLEARDVPSPVILDEAIRLAQRYGEEDSAGFINGVLDPLARAVRGEDRMPRPARGGTKG
ncbi:MAG: transcription antitermination factor NusB [Candidatus Eisenbacteria bacterium]|nr:transcription antitermination factor NusB [Candidatus Eisenbacteria bacterium]MCC7142459.1 transcription antitermination factor NusB [Candidatus Eisenbacteria bacterium]